MRGLTARGWTSGLEVPHQPLDQWPTIPSRADPDSVELRKSIVIGVTSEDHTFLIRLTWKDLVQITVPPSDGTLEIVILAARKGSRSRCFPSDLSGPEHPAADSGLGSQACPSWTWTGVRHCRCVWESGRHQHVDGVPLMGHHQSRQHLMDLLWEFRCPQQGHLGG